MLFCQLWISEIVIFSRLVFIFARRVLRQACRVLRQNRTVTFISTLNRMYIFNKFVYILKIWKVWYLFINEGFNSDFLQKYTLQQIIYNYYINIPILYSEQLINVWVVKSLLYFISRFKLYYYTKINVQSLYKLQTWLMINILQILLFSLLLL